MRLGLLARADHRGLATLTHLVWRLLRPAKTLVIDMGAHSPFPCQPELYPGAFATVTYDTLRAGHYDWGPFLADLDVIYTAEIPYDVRLFDEARSRGVRTVLHAMPELLTRGGAQPDVIAVPTWWGVDGLTASAMELLPVPAESLPGRSPGDGTIVHVVGSGALADRAGTGALLAALRLIRRPRRVIIRSQCPVPKIPRTCAEVEVEIGDVPNRADLYDGADVAVQPRRYGGLSLVAQEAVSAGLGLICGDWDHYSEAAWRTIRTDAATPVRMKGGTFSPRDCRPVELAAALDALDAEGVREARDSAAAWVRTRTWEALRPRWLEVLGG